MSDEKSALYFDQHAKLYDESRPDYPNEIYDIIAKTVSENYRENWLEIGAGNGAASGQILAKLKPLNLTLLEPGENFIKVLREKFSKSNNIKFIQDTFEDFATDEKFDAILAATAWHWPDAKMKYPHAAKLLKTDGWLIIFRNYYDLADENLNKKIDQLFAKYEGEISTETVHEKQLKKISVAHDEVRGSGIFEIIREKTIEWTKTISAENLINLYKTFQDSAKFGEQFFREMRDLIDSNEVEERVMTDLVIARRKK